MPQWPVSWRSKPFYASRGGMRCLVQGDVPRNGQEHPVGLAQVHGAGGSPGLGPLAVETVDVLAAAAQLALPAGVRRHGHHATTCCLPGGRSSMTSLTASWPRQSETWPPRCLLHPAPMGTARTFTTTKSSVALTSALSTKGRCRSPLIATAFIRARSLPPPPPVSTPRCGSGTRAPPARPGPGCAAAPRRFRPRSSPWRWSGRGLPGRRPRSSTS